MLGSRSIVDLIMASACSLLRFESHHLLACGLLIVLVVAVLLLLFEIARLKRLITFALIVVIITDLGLGRFIFITR
jgi:hypothetical protein